MRFHLSPCISCSQPFEGNALSAMLLVMPIAACMPSYILTCTHLHPMCYSSILLRQ